MEVEVPSPMDLPGVPVPSGDVIGVAPSCMDTRIAVVPTTRSHSRESMSFSGTLPPSLLFTHDY